VFQVGLPRVDYPEGVLGPPWRIIPKLPIAALSLDPPVLHDCSAVAVFHDRFARLVRCSCGQNAEARAFAVMKAHGGTALVLKGAMQLRSGLWYWPIVTKKVLVAKALDPLNARDRALISARLHASLLRAGRGEEAKYLNKALDSLDVEWGTLTEAQANAVVAETRAAAATIGTGASMVKATTSAGTTLLSTAEASRRSTLFGITESLALPDRKAIVRLATDMPFFVSADYGRRVQSWSDRDARAIITHGLRRGLDDIAIGKDLHAALSLRVTGRSEHYFRILANASLVRSSSYGQMTGYRDAGIRAYEWSAIGDGATCDICKYLDGQQFEVAGALTQFEAAQSDPDPEAGLMGMQSWLREVGGNIHVAPETRGGPLGPIVANIVESARGKEDTRGTYNTVTSLTDTNATQTPPAHGLCRCVTNPVF